MTMATAAARKAMAGVQVTVGDDDGGAYNYQMMGVRVWAIADWNIGV